MRATEWGGTPAQVRAERDRYRKALEEIRDDWEADDEGSCRYCPIQPEGHEPDCPVEIARRALSPEDDR